jgi:hypothetical protein
MGEELPNPFNVAREARRTTDESLLAQEEATLVTVEDLSRILDASSKFFFV